MIRVKIDATGRRVVEPGSARRRYEVPHCHIHVVPTDSMRQLDFANAAQSVDHDQLASHAVALREALAK